MHILNGKERAYVMRKFSKTRQHQKTNRDGKDRYPIEDITRYCSAEMWAQHEKDRLGSEPTKDFIADLYKINYQWKIDERVGRFGSNIHFYKNRKANGPKIQFTSC